jgi:hypothetical protein
MPGIGVPALRKVKTDIKVLYVFLFYTVDSGLPPAPGVFGMAFC